MNVDGQPTSRKAGTASVRGWQYLRSKNCSVMSGNLKRNSRLLRESYVTSSCAGLRYNRFLWFRTKRATRWPRSKSTCAYAWVSSSITFSLFVHCEIFCNGLESKGERGDPITCNIIDTVDTHVRRQVATIIGSRCDLVPQSSLRLGNLWEDQKLFPIEASRSWPK